MEANRDARADVPVVTAELIVENGRLAGTRRPLPAPVVLVGRDAGCDIRLNVEGVEPLHCVLAQVPGGLTLRDLGTPGGTVVNDDPVDYAELADGDVITIGPFRFRIALAASPASQPALTQEIEALRVQAAAVAAQQVALTETEAALEARRLALERQEEQLAHHLDERRQRLLDLQEEVRTARETLQKEQADWQERHQAAERELEQARRDAEQGLRDFEKQRSRMATLKDRLKRHYERQIATERGTIRQREAELSAMTRLAEREKDRLEKARTALTQAQLELNGERELARRALQDGWDQLHRERQQWQERQTAEQAEWKQQERARREREEVLARRETELAEQQKHWEEMRLSLHQEAEGLEQRIRNARRKVSDLEQELVRLGRQKEGPSVPLATPVTEAGGPAKSPAPPRPLVSESALEGAETLTAELIDQRRQLVEQCERFVAIQDEWRWGLEESLRGIEEAQRRLHERERAVEVREQTAAAAEEALIQRRRELAESHHHLEGARARVAARQAVLEAEHNAAAHQVRAREELVARQQEFLLALRERWAQRRRNEMRQVRSEHDQIQNLRQRYVGLWEECFRRRVALDEEHRSLAEQKWTLEQLRHELLGQSRDAAAVDKRLDKLRDRIAETMASAERNLIREQQALQVEAARLTQVADRLQIQAVDLATREEELSDRQADWDREQAVTEVARLKLQQELRNVQGQRHHAERQVQQLREELERVARLLIDGEDDASTSVLRAA